MAATSKILDLATRVRKACVLYVLSDACDPSADYYRDRSLGCMCAVASHTLQKVLARNGISSKLISGYFDEDGDWSAGNSDENHCWLDTHGKVLDITATQFGTPSTFPPVVFIPRKSATLWHPSRLVHDPSDLMYPETQMPNRKIENFIFRRVKNDCSIPRIV